MLFAAGCNLIPSPTPDSTRYYVLAGPALGAAGVQPVTGVLRLGLRNVEVAPYLKKGSLVVRTGENEVRFPDEARWGDPLEREILSSLRGQLLAAPAVGRVFVQPFPFDEPRDYDVSVRVIRCEGVDPAGGGKASVSFAAMLASRLHSNSVPRANAGTALTTHFGRPAWRRETGAKTTAYSSG